MRVRRGEGLRKPVHGAISDHELSAFGLDPSDVADFSHNSNPFGPLPVVEAAARRADLARYPDPEATALRRAIAAREGLHPDQVFCGNGSNELFWLIALAYLQAGDRALVLGPTYGEYERACEVAGARMLTLSAAPPEFRHAPTELARVAAAHDPRVVFLCNPNNPTGVYLEPSEVRALLAPVGNGLIVVDESYLGFVSHGCSYIRRPGNRAEPRDLENLIVVRSMTKDHALAGVRLAYALTSTRTAGALRQVRPYWNVNAVALSAGLAAAEHAAEQAVPLDEVRVLREYLAAALADLGLAVLPTATNFFLVHVGNAAEFRAALLSRGCVVRDCTSFGLPEYVRIAARTRPECDRLIAAVRDALRLATIAPR